MPDNGQIAEDLAATFLQQQGLQLLMRNYRCRFGEIDLILQENDTLVFVEVRLRRDERFGGAAASITPQKQRKLVKTAHHFLMAHPPCYTRFDVILLTTLETSTIQWLKNAFDSHCCV